jgi:tRNA (mo5U34)-methyltransferase
MIFILGNKLMTTEEILKLVNSFPYWYHKIELPLGIVTPGWAPINASSYGVPQRLDGLRVLDVGAWDGYWTFEALKRGAKEVVAIDDFSDTLGSLNPEERKTKAWGTFDAVKAILNYNESQCKRLEMNVYEVNEQTLGRFDVVFMFGTLYHFRHPLLALDCVSAICDGDIYVESAILDDYSPYRGGLGQGYFGQQMVIEFYPGNQYGNNPTNWWVPTLHCLAHMILAAGFSQCKYWKLTESPSHLSVCRGFVFGTKKAK